jgi:hypothetical protein
MVRVVRPGHPLHGLDLPVWGRLRLRGVAMVVLVLPDGSKKRIPAAWAGEGGSGNRPRRPPRWSRGRRICCSCCG